MKLGDADLIVGAGKAIGIAQENSAKPIYTLFLTELTDVKDKFSRICEKCRFAAIAWHKEVGLTNSVVKTAISCYLKYRDLVIEILPGANLITWASSNATPAQIEVAIESILSIIDNHKEQLPFADAALDELKPLMDSFDKELETNRTSLRTYRNLVDEKDEAKTEIKKLFYKFRRFVRRDKGMDSPEYGQLKDHAVRKAREEEMPSVTLSTRNLA
jgi:hypothetical protein